MNISKRLKSIADLIPIKSKVIDVGCDHALLDIYLTINKDCNCLACDISSNALKSANENILKYGLNDKIKTIQTDGLNSIKINKNDYIVISGMGTSTIKHILNNQKLSDNLVISSNNEIDVLRMFVVELGYLIENEIFIEDKNKYYVIINFKKGKNNYNENDLIYGPILKKNLDYINYLKKNLILIRKKIPFYKLKLKLEINKKIKKLDSLNS